MTKPATNEQPIRSILDNLKNAMQALSPDERRRIIHEVALWRFDSTASVTRIV